MTEFAKKVAKSSGSAAKCPHCGETNLDIAVICRRCRKVMKVLSPSNFKKFKDF